MDTPVIPTLGLGTQDLLNNREAMVWHIVLFTLINPGNTSDIMESQLVSFRKIEAEYEHNPDTIASEYAKGIQGIIFKYYPNDGIVVNILANNLEDVNYGLSIEIIDGQGNNLLNLDSVTVRGDSIEVNYGTIKTIRG